MPAKPKTFTFHGPEGDEQALRAHLANVVHAAGAPADLCLEAAELAADVCQAFFDGAHAKAADKADRACKRLREIRRRRAAGPDGAPAPAGDPQDAQDAQDAQELPEMPPFRMEGEADAASVSEGVAVRHFHVVLHGSAEGHVHAAGFGEAIEAVAIHGFRVVAARVEEEEEL